MSRTVDEQTGKFVAKDQEGNERVLVIITSFDEVWTGDRFEKFPKRQSIRTSGGRPVSRLDQGKYEVFNEPGVVFVSEDPIAP